MTLMVNGEKRECFNKVVEPLRKALHRTGNRHNKQAQGKWPWHDMWHYALDPATLPIIRADDYKRVQWGRLFVFWDLRTLARIRTGDCRAKNGMAAPATASSRAAF